MVRFRFFFSLPAPRLVSGNNGLQSPPLRQMSTPRGERSKKLDRPIHGPNGSAACRDWPHFGAIRSALALRGEGAESARHRVHCWPPATEQIIVPDTKGNEKVEALMTASDEAAVVAVFGTLKKNWGWLLALGVVSIVLGTIGLYMTFALTLATVLLFGALILVGGLFQLGHSFTCKGWKSVLGHVLIALLYLAAGFVIITDPVLASDVLTLVLAGILIAVGVIRILMAFQLRTAVAGWYWALLSGIISILLGIIIVAQWPVSGLWVIGLLVAIELIFHGWSYVFVALAARKAAAGGSVAA
jgi:uncharacterized membrane protein HdeD (DUF308 family)